MFYNKFETIISTFVVKIDELGISTATARQYNKVSGE